MSDPFNDDSRWTVMSARFETPDFIRDEMRSMMRDFVNSLPVDDPARLLWAVLPQAPGWEIGLNGGAAVSELMDRIAEVLEAHPITAETGFYAGETICDGPDCHLCVNATTHLLQAFSKAFDPTHVTPRKPADLPVRDPRESQINPPEEGAA